MTMLAHLVSSPTAFAFLSGLTVGAFITVAIVIAAAAFGTALAARLSAHRRPRAPEDTGKTAKVTRAPPSMLPPTPAGWPDDAQVRAALTALKFTKAEIEMAMSRIPSTGTVPERVRAALRSLQRPPAAAPPAQ